MQLSKFMEEEGLDDEAMAKRVRTPSIHCDRTMISRYRRGLRRPEWDVIARIRKVSGGRVTAADFEELVRLTA